MRSLSAQNRTFFKKKGRQGGLRRARRLSAVQRSTIASKAARMRWRRNATKKQWPKSFRLQAPLFSDPVYLEEVLNDGTIDLWREVYLEIADKPFGEVALVLEKVLSVTKIYGITPLWQGLLKRLRGAMS